MRVEIVAVRDSAASAFMNPWHAPSTGMALRSFRDECNRGAEGNILFQHPEDFELWHFGSFEQADGSFDLFAKPVMLIRGKDCVEKRNV